MTLEDFYFQIPQYLSAQLTPAARASFEEQLALSPELRAEVEQLRPVWQALAELPEELPSAALRARFYQRLNAIERGRPLPAARSPRWWHWARIPQIGIAAAVFLLGILVGRIDLNGRAHSEEIAQMKSQVQSLREMFALSLLERQQSATSRLQGVSWSSHVDQPDGELLSALSRALSHDPNVNVRLSALDALEKFSSDPTVRKALLDAIPLQDSPLVQISLIDALVHMHDTSAALELKRLSANAQLNPAVQQRARWALQQLGY